MILAALLVRVADTYIHPKAPDQGYSGWVNLPDGRIFVVNYIRDDGPMAQIRGYFFTEQEF